MDDILDLPMEANDADASTIRGYLKALLLTLWEEQESFSGKRPFGNSGWEYDLYTALAKAKKVKATFDDEGCIEEADTERADELIRRAIANL